MICSTRQQLEADVDEKEQDDPENNGNEIIGERGFLQILYNDEDDEQHRSVDALEEYIDGTGLTTLVVV